MRHLTVAVLLATVVGCRGRSDPPEFEHAAPDTVDRGSLPSLTVLMDSAAAALADGNYEEARRLYQAAASGDTTLAAPWFGLFMARRGLGLAPAADSALDRARNLVVNPIGPHTTGTRN
jgi:hypothetical protein